MNISRQKGNVVPFLLPLIVVGGIFAYLFSMMSGVIPAGGPVPYVFVSLFIFPIATIWPLLKDLTELQEIGTITKTERERLSVMVADIQRYLKVSALLLLFFGGLTGAVLYFVVVNSMPAKTALSGIGFFVGCAICIFVFLFNLRTKIQNYKAKVVSRAEELKQSKKLIKRFKSDEK